MPTYEEAVTLGVNLKIFAGREYTLEVSNQLEPNQSFTKTDTHIEHTLKPVQTITGIFPEITTTLVPVQTIVKNISSKTVELTLVPVQTIRKNISKKTISSTLEFSQIIDTSGSVLTDKTLLVNYNVEVDFTASLSLDGIRAVTTTLVPTQGILGWLENYITISGTKYAIEDIYVG